MSIVQTVICFAVAVPLGLDLSTNVLLAIIFIIPTAWLNISIGLLCGSLFTDKQVGGICGALLTNLTAWLSGIWFDLNLVGDAFKKIAYMLPFVHSVEIERAAVNGNYSDILPHLFWVLGYAAVLTVIAIYAFLRQMKKQ